MGHIKQFICFVFCLFLVAASVSTPTFAARAKDCISDSLSVIYKENNILFWNPCETPSDEEDCDTVLDADGNFDDIMNAKNADKQYSDLVVPRWGDNDTAKIKAVVEAYGDLAYRLGKAVGAPWTAIIVQMRYEDPESNCGKNNFWGNGCPPGTSAGQAKIQGKNLGEGFAQYGQTLTNGRHDQAIGISDAKEYLEKIGPTWVQGNINGAGYGSIEAMKKSVDALEAFLETAEGKALMEDFGIGSYTNCYADVADDGDGTDDSITPSESAKVSTDSRLAWLFPDGVPTTESEMKKYLTTITVPIINSSGNQSTAVITIHKKLASAYQAIFQEMLGVKNFRIKSIGGFNWRKMASGTGSLSHHSYGVAVDLNPDENPASYTSGSYNPGSNYYSIPTQIVNIWKKHGFYWGGDWSGHYKDYMHFSYTNH